MSEELKELNLCPFCGHAPRVDYCPDFSPEINKRLSEASELEEPEKSEAFARINFAREYYANIYCEYCEAETKSFTSYGNPDDAINAAITMWNNGFIYAHGEELPYRLFRALERLS